jgi:hypothetical protein
MAKSNNSKLWQAIITFLTAVSVATAGWAFTQIRDMPYIYQTKIRAAEDRQEFCRRLERIEDKIDTLLLKEK